MQDEVCCCLIARRVGTCVAFIPTRLQAHFIKPWDNVHGPFKSSTIPVIVTSSPH